MKPLIMALIALPLLSGVALAEAADRGVVQASDAEAGSGSGVVDRAVARAATLGQTKLAPAGVADVDANSDGKISFTELLRHDVKSDF